MRVVFPPLFCSASGMKRLAILDRFLALWILLSMGIGIILGYFVPNTSVVLEKVQFVNVSLPLGALFSIQMYATDYTDLKFLSRSYSNRPYPHDVAYSVPCLS